MSLEKVTVQIPATTANLGPGFDCLAMALDLWNQAVFTLQESGFRVDVEGEGAGQIQSDCENLMVRAFNRFYQRFEIPAPPGLYIQCINHVPLSSGLGSSATASLAGLLAAQAFSGYPTSKDELLHMACELEGHPDNAAAALLGGLAIAIWKQDLLITRRIELPNICTVVVLPAIKLSTKLARAALPLQVSLKDAVYNLGRTALVVEALRDGDLNLLGQCMEDRLHQPYRLELIPGAKAALEAARFAGAHAAVISGAGPSLIAFPSGDPEPIARAMQAELARYGIPAREFILRSTNRGALVE
jgi:homoserine kinase